MAGYGNKCKAQSYFPQSRPVWKARQYAAKARGGLASADNSGCRRACGVGGAVRLKRPRRGSMISRARERIVAHATTRGHGRGHLSARRSARRRVVRGRCRRCTQLERARKWMIKSAGGRHVAMQDGNFRLGWPGVHAARYGRAVCELSEVDARLFALRGYAGGYVTDEAWVMGAPMTTTLAVLCILNTGFVRLAVVNICLMDQDEALQPGTTVRRCAMSQSTP